MPRQAKEGFFFFFAWSHLQATKQKETEKERKRKANKGKLSCTRERRGKRERKKGRVRFALIMAVAIPEIRAPPYGSAPYVTPCLSALHLLFGSSLLVFEMVRREKGREAYLCPAQIVLYQSATINL